MTDQIPEIARYRQELRDHDWYYEMSDDPGVYARGNADRASLRRQQEHLDPEYRLWNEFAPDMYKMKKL